LLDFAVFGQKTALALPTSFPGAYRRRDEPDDRPGMGLTHEPNV